MGWNDKYIDLIRGKRVVVKEPPKGNQPIVIPAQASQLEADIIKVVESDLAKDVLPSASQTQ